MSTLQDRRAAFMAQPITRTLTFQQDELDAFAAWGAREDSKGDKGLPNTQINADIIVHWFNIHNYKVTFDGLDRAVQETRHILEWPTQSIDSGKQWVSSDPEQVVRRGGLLSHTDTARTNVEISQSTKKLIAETQDTVRKAGRNTEFLERKRVIDGVLVNSRTPGLIDRAASVRERIDRWEAAKTDFPEAEYIAAIDKEIAKEMGKLR